MTCNGNGVCLACDGDEDGQDILDSFLDENGKRWFRTIDCNCIPMKCPNYLLCKNISTEINYSYSRGRCLNCDIYPGRNLIFIEKDEDCHICFEPKNIYIKFTGCQHSCCLDCFKCLTNKRCTLCRRELSPEWRIEINNIQAS